MEKNKHDYAGDSIGQVKGDAEKLGLGFADQGAEPLEQSAVALEALEAGAEHLGRAQEIMAVSTGASTWGTIAQKHSVSNV